MRCEKLVEWWDPIALPKTWQCGSASVCGSSCPSRKLVALPDDREPVLHGLHGDLFLPQGLHGQDGGVGGLERGGA